MNPAVPTRCCAAGVICSHIVWYSPAIHACAYLIATGSGAGGPGSHAVSTAPTRNSPTRASGGGRARSPLRTLVASSDTFAPRIGARCEHAVLADRDRLRAARDVVPLGEQLDLVTLPAEGAADVLGEPRLHPQGPPGLVG